MLGSRCELLRCDRCLPDDCVLTSTSFLGSTTKVLTALPQSGGELPPRFVEFVASPLMLHFLKARERSRALDPLPR